jgi:hypothetical protein
MEKYGMTWYIEFLNAAKGYANDRKYFEGENAFEQAVAWGRVNLENFSMDMVRVAKNV